MKAVSVSKDEMKALTKKEIIASERRVEYDVKQKGNEIIQLIETTAASSDLKTFLEQPFISQLPLTTVENFEVFDTDLKINQELRQKLVNIHIIIIYNKSNIFNIFLLHLKFKVNLFYL